MPAILPLLHAALADPNTGWSLGVLGALGEFLWAAGEPAASGPLHRVTARGGVALAPVHPALRLIAWEEPGAAGHWRQGASLCLPAAAAAIGGADALTELGPDEAALRPAERAGVLFDLGLGFPQLRACIRTADPALLAVLRAGCGRSLFAAGNLVAGAILAASPHRVFVSALARVEVFQPIPPPGGASPEGPHTHLLPALLRARRSHPATKPLPQGWVSCIDFHPGHPLRDGLGRPTPFDAARHAAFQALLEAHGLPPLVAEKRRLAAALRAGLPPAAHPAPADRHGRAARRVALRQLGWAEPDLPALPAWQAAFDLAAANRSVADRAEDGRAG